MPKDLTRDVKLSESGRRKMRRPHLYEERARELCLAAGIDPDIRLGEGRGRPAWVDYPQPAREEHIAREQLALAALPTQNPRAPDPIVVGNHDEGTVGQMRNCMGYGDSVAGVICADGHLGHAQPVGGVIAYRDQISVSGGLRLRRSDGHASPGICINRAA